MDSDIDKFEIGFCPDHKLLIEKLFEEKGFDLENNKNRFINQEQKQ